MSVLIFLIGTLIGVVVGSAICVRYLRQEVAARIGPKMDLLQMQMETLQSAVNLALANWHAELHQHRMSPYRPEEIEYQQRLSDRGF